MFIIVVTSNGCTDEACTDDSYCCEAWVDGLNWATTSIVGGHAARKHERTSGEESDEEFCFHKVTVVVFSHFDEALGEFIQSHRKKVF